MERGIRDASSICCRRMTRHAHGALLLPACHQGVYARLRRAMEKVGMRGPSASLSVAETRWAIPNAQTRGEAPHPHRIPVFRRAVWPSPRARGEVLCGVSLDPRQIMNVD